MEIFAILGFCLAAYSIVANDAIQTLGTFLASNAKRPWWVLWIFGSTVLAATLIYGYVRFGGDVSYGRLERIPMPDGGVQWWHVLPPAVILVLTRFGVPVSTTFLVLTVFAPGALVSMLTKSMLGYGVAFTAALILYLTAMRAAEKYFIASAHKTNDIKWVILQWCSTAFLWAQWLIQDLANIYVYLPRDVDVLTLSWTMILMIGLLGVIFYRFGGEIQKIVTSKTNTTDIRSASIIDLLFGIVLFIFKNLSNIPMSTTWVFLGVLAGRELAFAITTKVLSKRQTGMLILSDATKALIGLAVSVALSLIITNFLM